MIKGKRETYRDIIELDRFLAEILILGIIEASEGVLDRESILYSGDTGSRKKKSIIARSLLCLKLYEHLEGILNLNRLAELLGFPENGVSNHCAVIHYIKTYRNLGINDGSAWASFFFKLKGGLEEFLENSMDYKKYQNNPKEILLVLRTEKTIRGTSAGSTIEILDLEETFSIEEFKDAIYIDSYGENSSDLRINALSGMLVSLNKSEKDLNEKKYKNYRKDYIPLSVIKKFMVSQRFAVEYAENVLDKLSKAKAQPSFAL